MSETKVKPQELQDEFGKNRYAFSPDELRPFAGQWVAWSADGRRIIAHHENVEEVGQRVLAAGMKSEDVVLECLPTLKEFEALL